jgi:hypothetical protein
MLRVLCLDCTRLVIGDALFLVKIGGMFPLGDGLLDVWDAVI